MRIDRLKIFLDSMGGGAWPFLVGGVICLVNSVNERDLSLLISCAYSLPSLPRPMESVPVLRVLWRLPNAGELQGRLTDKISW